MDSNTLRELAPKPRDRFQFSALSVGYLNGSKLIGGLSYTQSLGTGQTDETWVTSWTNGTLARMTAVANTPKIGVAPNGVKGLRLRETWKNYVRNSENFSWTVTGTGVVSTNDTVSPDGTSNADTLTDNDGAAYELVTATIDGIPTDTERYLLEVFVKDTSANTHAAAINWSLTGGTPIARSERLNPNDGTFTGTGAGTVMPVFGSWYRWQGLIDGNGTNTGVSLGLYPAATTIPLPGSDTSAGQGSISVYGASVTRGKLKRDYQPTPSGSGATCNACALTIPALRVVRGGRVRLRFQWSPAGQPTDYNVNFRLFDSSAETSYCEFSASDQKLRIVVAGGSAEVCNVPLWWPAAQLYTTSHPIVEFDIEVGGNVASRIRYRYSIDGGVTWTLPFDPMGGTAGVAQGNISSAGNLGLMTGSSAGTVADGWLHDSEIIKASPAWALQWLPTDDANVKAWFRADGHYTLNSTTVSAWQSQTATAISATQGTAAFQPTFSLTGFSSKPGFIFDGSNDGLVVSGLSASSGDILVVTAIKPNSSDVAHRLIFDTQTGRLFCFHSSAGGPGNASGWYDGSYKSGGSSTTNAQILAFDLRASGTSGKVFRDGAQLGSSLVYSAKAIGGSVSIGANYTSSADCMFANMGGIVIATGQNDTLRRNIEAFYSSQYGIAVV